jgi:hypothetical protein
MKRRGASMGMEGGACMAEDSEKDEAKVRAAKARAQSLTANERRAIAAKAAAARWGRTFKATHKGSFKEDFGLDVECFVLDDEPRSAVVSQRGMGAAIGLGDAGGRLPTFLRGQKIAPYVGHELAEKLSNPLIFQWSTSGANTPPAVVYGYDVTMLIDICKAIIAAADAGKLLARQAHIAKQAHVILNASAKWGIRDLVYRLAGYDATKAEAVRAFKLYVQEEARQWEKEFPDQLYEQWYRLYNLPKPARNKPWKFKHLTVDQVYTPLAQSSGKVYELTRALRDQSGERWKKLHQFLSEIGVKALRTHLGRLLGMAEVSKTKVEYEGHVARVFGKQLILDLGEPS